ncbi:MAG: class I SAM-dependent methyltransferase [Burkholderiaceae bacterium]|jgi:SAM-dependent methyltransferase|nr:class I SAM-dependent methyltransferase [Burkholderiaceae bacterium]
MLAARIPDIDAPTAAAQPPLDPRCARPQLRRWLRKLHKAFDIDQVRREVPDGTAVAHYYTVNEAAYRRYHSSEGAVHMALNPDGRFDTAGFAGQLERIEADWGGGAGTCAVAVRTGAAALPPAEVLELAFGQGYNLAYLLPRHPAVRFEGVDLTPAHVEHARARLAGWPQERLRLMQGDFHQLPQPDASFDAAYCIESLCHAMDLGRALREVARVLRAGGRLVLFDGYLPRPAHELDVEAALAVELVAKGMAIDRLQTLDELSAAAHEAGFEVAASHALDLEVLPNLERLERITGAVVRWPWLGRRALARRPAARSRNVLAGCLLRSAVSLRLITYRQIVLLKR